MSHIYEIIIYINYWLWGKWIYGVGMMWNLNLFQIPNNNKLVSNKLHSGLQIYINRLRVIEIIIGIFLTYAMETIFM